MAIELYGPACDELQDGSITVVPDASPGQPDDARVTSGAIGKARRDLVEEAADDVIVLQPLDPANQKQGFSLSDGRIANLNDQDYVVDIKDRNEDDGANVVAWEFHGGDNQYWDVEYFD